MQNLCLDPEFGRDPGYGFKSEGCEGYFYKIIKLVVLIMGGGEHSSAADTKKGPSNL